LTFSENPVGSHDTPLAPLAGSNWSKESRKIIRGAFPKGSPNEATKSSFKSSMPCKKSDVLLIQ
jgi:hypothetical protein